MTATMDVIRKGALGLRGAPGLHTWHESECFCVVLQLLADLKGDVQKVRDGTCLNVVSLYQAFCLASPYRVVSLNPQCHLRL